MLGDGGLEVEYVTLSVGQHSLTRRGIQDRAQRQGSSVSPYRWTPPRTAYHGLTFRFEVHRLLRLNSFCEDTLEPEDSADTPGGLWRQRIGDSAVHHSADSLLDYDTTYDFLCDDDIDDDPMNSFILADPPAGKWKTVNCGIGNPADMCQSSHIADRCGHYCTYKSADNMGQGCYTTDNSDYCICKPAESVGQGCYTTDNSDYCICKPAESVGQGCYTTDSGVNYGKAYPAHVKQSQSCKMELVFNEADNSIDCTLNGGVTASLGSETHHTTPTTRGQSTSHK